MIHSLSERKRLETRIRRWRARRHLIEIEQTSRRKSVFLRLHIIHPLSRRWRTGSYPGNGCTVSSRKLKLLYQTAVPLADFSCNTCLSRDGRVSSRGFPAKLSSRYRASLQRLDRTWFSHCKERRINSSFASINQLSKFKIQFRHF